MNTTSIVNRAIAPSQSFSLLGGILNIRDLSQVLCLYLTLRELCSLSMVCNQGKVRAEPLKNKITSNPIVILQELNKLTVKDIAGFLRCLERSNAGIDIIRKAKSLPLLYANRSAEIDLATYTCFILMTDNVNSLDWRNVLECKNYYKYTRKSKLSKLVTPLDVLYRYFQNTSIYAMGLELFTEKEGYINLSGSVLDNNRFWLGSANLSYAKLVGASFKRSHVPKVNFFGADMRNTDFANAIVSNINIDKAMLAGSNITVNFIDKVNDLFKLGRPKEEIIDEIADSVSANLWSDEEKVEFLKEIFGSNLFNTDEEKLSLVNRCNLLSEYIKLDCTSLTDRLDLCISQLEINKDHLVGFTIPIIILNIDNSVDEKIKLLRTLYFHPVACNHKNILKEAANTIFGKSTFVTERQKKILNAITTLELGKSEVITQAPARII